MRTPSEMAYEWLGENDETKGLERAIEARDAEHAAAITQSREECGEMKARLDRAVALLETHVADAHEEDVVDIQRFLASLASPSQSEPCPRCGDELPASMCPAQPEPVKTPQECAYVYSSVPPSVCDIPRYRHGKSEKIGHEFVAPIVPENAGTTCGACKEKGGFDRTGKPTFDHDDRNCGICAGTGRAK